MYHRPRAKNVISLLHLLGLDHKKLTFGFQGRDYRLTNMHGEILCKLLA